MSAPTLPGRNKLVRQVAARLSAFDGGPSNAVLITGEPGIGKSEFTRTICEIAGESDWAVGFVECGHLSSISSFFPVRQMLSDLGVASELGEATPAADQPGAARTALFESVSSSLRELLEKRDVMLVIDDAHLADESSHALLSYLVEDLRDWPLTAVLVGESEALRHSRSLAPTISSLLRADRCLMIELGGLDAEGCIEMIQSIEGRVLDLNHADRLIELTGGNPFLLNQLAQSGQIDSARVETGTGYAAPAAVRFSVLEGVQELGPVAYKVLSTAALIGPSFTVEELTSSCGLPAPDVISSLSEGARLGLLRRWSAADKRVSFSHGMARELLTEGIPVAERFALHQQIVIAFEKIHAGNLEDYAEFLAAQCEVIGPVIGWDSCVRYMLIAASKALSSHAYEDAIGWYSRGLELSGGVRDDPQSASLLSGLAQALLHVATTSAERQKGFERQKQAVEMFLRLGAHGDALRVAAITEGSLASAAWNLDFIQDIYDNTPDDLRGTSDFGRICNKLGLAHGILLGDRAAADKHFDEAEALGGSESVTDRLSNRGSVAGFWHMDHQSGLDQCLAAIGHPSAAHTPLRALADSVAILIRMGDARATAYCEQLRQAAVASQDATYLSLSSVSSMMWSTITGDLEAAEESYEAAVGPGVGTCQIESIASIVAFEKGNEDAGREHLDRMIEAASSNQQIVVLDAAVASVTLAFCTRYYSTEFGERIAGAWASQVLDNPTSTPLVKMVSACALALLNEEIPAAAAGLVAAHLGELVPFVPMTVDQISGHMAVDKGRATDAVPFFDSAVSSSRASGFRLIEAHAIVDRIVAASGSDSRRNRRVRELAGEFSGEAVLTRHSDAIDSRKRPGGLTPKEYEILGLMAQGLTNRQIAEKIDRTIYNVQSHIYNIFPKLDVENRATAISKAFELGYV